MDDFDPARIVAQVEPLNRLLEARNKIRDLLTKVDRSEDLEGLLERILSKPDQLAQLSSELGETTSAAQGEAKP
jgi:type VI secretion system protein ImpB